MASANVMLSLPQMVDLAINYPEGGSVNFSMLHSVLQVVIQQLELLSCNVEFRGKDGDRVQGLLDVKKKAPQTFNLAEYIVTPAKDAGKLVSRKRRRGKKKDDDKVIHIDDIPSEEDLQTVVVVDTDHITDKTTSVEPTIISSEKIDKIQEDVNKLKQVVTELVEMPANQTIIDAMRKSVDGTTSSNPVLEMFQSISLSKRMDAAEAGMLKLASMMEDLFKVNPEMGASNVSAVEGGTVETFGDRMYHLETRILNVEQVLTSSGAVLPEVYSGAAQVGQEYSTEGGYAEEGGSYAGASTGQTAAQPGQAADQAGEGGQVVQGGRHSEEHGRTKRAPHDKPFERPRRLDVQPVASASGYSESGAGSIATRRKPVRKAIAKVELKPPSTAVPDFAAMNLEEFENSVFNELMVVKGDIKQLYDNLGGMATVMANISPEELIDSVRRPPGAPRKPAVQKMNGVSSKDTSGGQTTEDEDNLEAADDRIGELENLFQDINQQIISLDSNFNNEFQNLQTQFVQMEKEFGVLMEKIHNGLPGGDSQIAGETVGELYEKILGIQTDMESLAETASKLMEDKDQKERLMDMLTEQIDMLKTIKADKEDLEDALADKADACAINRKVSHDQFDTACDELSKGIEEALSKLTQQEQLWQQALDEIQREIGNKLDRMELGPLRDFINQKLKMLQQRLKALMTLKQETEAAGTKKFLKNVQCISCDKDVIMRKELDPSLLPQSYALPPTRSMGPYLAYELDALRKQQKALPTSRNLNHFENALSQKSPRGDDHICNRYCGGSHTITTPQQRVTRLGHFLNQWGPEAQPVLDAIKDEEVLFVAGKGSVTKPSEQSVSPKISKEGAGEAPVTDRKDSKELSKKPSLSIQDKKLSDKRSSKTSAGSRQGSASLSKTGRASAQQVSLGTKTSQTSARKPSQTSNRSLGSAKEKSGSKMSANRISEESPSEVAEATAEGVPPPSETGAGEAEGGDQVPVEDAVEAPAAVKEEEREAEEGPPAQE